VHSLKSCPRGRFLAVLTSTFASGWSYREIALWDYYSSSAPTPLTVPGYGWKYQSSREEKGEGLCCLEWSPTGLYLAVGARSVHLILTPSAGLTLFKGRVRGGRELDDLEVLSLLHHARHFHLLVSLDLAGRLPLLHKQSFISALRPHLFLLSCPGCFSLGPII
jgi:hypothetical protein